MENTWFKVRHIRVVLHNFDLNMDLINTIMQEVLELNKFHNRDYSNSKLIRIETRNNDQLVALLFKWRCSGEAVIYRKKDYKTERKANGDIYFGARGLCFIPINHSLIHWYNLDNPQNRIDDKNSFYLPGDDVTMNTDIALKYLDKVRCFFYLFNTHDRGLARIASYK